MNAVLRITNIVVEGTNEDYATLRILLENAGYNTVAPGELIGRQTLNGGEATPLSLPCSIRLAPGEKARLSLLLPASLKAIDLTGYRTREDTMVRLSGLRSWWLSPWSLKAA